MLSSSQARPTGQNLEILAPGLLERSDQNSTQTWDWKLQVTRKAWSHHGQMETLLREPGDHHQETGVFIQPEDPCGHTETHLTPKKHKMIFLIQGIQESVIAGNLLLTSSTMPSPNSHPYACIHKITCTNTQMSPPPQMYTHLTL